MLKCRCILHAQGADSEVIAEEDTKASLNGSTDLADSYNYDEMTEEQYYDWYYGLGEYATVEEDYQEGHYGL